MKLIILGAESLGREVAEVASLSGYDVAFLDDRPELAGQSVSGYPVLGPFGAFKDMPPAAFFVAVGTPTTREKWMEQIASHGFNLANIYHPLAAISKTATIGGNCFVNAHSFIGPNVSLEKGALLWSGVSISHDCIVGPVCFFAPGVGVGGYTRIGTGCMFGINAAIRSDATIGDWSIVAMGSIVAEDVPPAHYVRPGRQPQKITDRAPWELFFRDHSSEAQKISSATVK